MSKHIYLVIVTAALAGLLYSPVMAQTDSIWIETITANPGGIYSVSMHCRIYQQISGLEVPLISTGQALVFDVITKEGSIIPEEMIIGGIIKNDGNRIRISFIPTFPLNPIEPPGGKLCEIHFHVRPNAIDQMIAMDTLTDTIYSNPLTLAWLRGWAPDGVTQIPLAFGKGQIEVVSGMPCGDANNDGDINVSDAQWVTNFIFVGGEPSALYYLADVNVDDRVNITDVVYLINFVYSGGPEPCAS